MDLLTALVDKSLVTREPEALGHARYRMLDTIREFAAAQFAEAGETALFQRRMRDYTVRETEEGRRPSAWPGCLARGRPGSTCSARYDIDAGNLTQVLNWCLADGDPESGLRLCVGIRPVWIVRGSFAEGIEWLDSFLSLGASRVPDRVRGGALTERAQLTMSRDPAAAEPDAARGLELSRWPATPSASRRR